MATGRITKRSVDALKPGDRAGEIGRNWGARKTRAPPSVLRSLYAHAGKRVGLSGIGHFIRRYRNATVGFG